MRKFKPVKISKEQVKEVIEQIPFTAFFGVEFIKKDGFHRRMNCNRSISKNLKHQKQPTPIKTSSLTVFDVNVDGYRKVNLETVYIIRTNKKTYIVE